MLKNLKKIIIFVLLITMIIPNSASAATVKTTYNVLIDDTFYTNKDISVIKDGKYLLVDVKALDKFSDDIKVSYNSTNKKITVKNLNYSKKLVATANKTSYAWYSANNVKTKFTVKAKAKVENGKYYVPLTALKEIMNYKYFSADACKKSEVEEIKNASGIVAISSKYYYEDIAQISKIYVNKEAEVYSTILGNKVYSPNEWIDNVDWEEIFGANDSVISEINNWCEETYDDFWLGLQQTEEGVRFSHSIAEDYGFTYNQEDGFYVFEMYKEMFDKQDTKEGELAAEKARQALQVLMVSTLPNGQELFDILSHDISTPGAYVYKESNTWYEIGNVYTKYNFIDGHAHTYFKSK